MVEAEAMLSVAAVLEQAASGDYLAMAEIDASMTGERSGIQFASYHFAQTLSAHMRSLLAKGQAALILSDNSTAR
jgi:uncharacterized membrane protein